jgi:hypothetical protein
MWAVLDGGDDMIERGGTCAERGGSGSSIWLEEGSMVEPRWSNT